MSNTSIGGSERVRHEPRMVDSDTMRLYGVGPECPGCGGPTHALSGGQEAERPWWCKECNVRLDDNGEYGQAACFPSGADPSTTSDTCSSEVQTE